METVNKASNSVLIDNNRFFMHDGKPSGSHELPFANYLQQALWGVNDGVIEAARGWEEVGFGKGPGLQNVATTDFETHFLLYLSAGIASNLTKAATTFFQMQF